ncbi:hypothetical protein ANN_13185 [Periplaneta americana]|uniref:Dipeptidase n=1 Tax=Periplaneta americana TaxID=6978 RepID=A0ABQ8TJ72_PERAM|nr:hypothetical protein ANN_13185 [Periplaneta americana]
MLLFQLISTERTPLGLEDVSRYPYLLAELLGSGRWTEADLQKLAGKNLIRVFKKVEEVSVHHETTPSTYDKKHIFRRPVSTPVLRHLQCPATTVVPVDLEFCHLDSSVVGLGVRDRLLANGEEPIDERIPIQDVYGRTYCRYPET